MVEINLMNADYFYSEASWNIRKDMRITEKKVIV